MNRQNNVQITNMRPANMDELEWIQFRRRQVKQRLEASRTNMRHSYNCLTGKEEIPSDKWGKTAFWLSKSGTIINGVRIGVKIGGIIGTLIKLRRTFARKHR